MTTWLRRRIPTLILSLAILAGSFWFGGCEVEENTLCFSVARQICDKRFGCFPAVSASLYGTEEDCVAFVSVNCADSEALYGCDLDNEDLRDCENQIDSSACGSLPASCQAMIECPE